MELSKTYNPEQTESPWYPRWEKNGYFKPSQSESPSFCIVIPPPNVTGSLHMGHALNNTLQDVLSRWNRMQGKRTMWVPGTDHGGIATQNVVEKLLKAEKLTRHDLGREKFLERMWKWRQEAGDTILMQLRRLGASLEWDHYRFTMDDHCSRAVRKAFVSLFKDGLVYRGPRMVNWCPRCQTALSDIEVEKDEKKPVKGSLWHIRYPAGDGSGSIVVATTRPETMLGDTAVAVNPADERYRSLHGKKLKLPLTGREIPIVLDDAVDMTFGTGAVKVTPAHDPTDFEIGERHKLPQIVVIGFDGKMTTEAGEFAGQDRFEARKAVVAALEQLSLLEKIEDHQLIPPLCYRCATVIEPLVSEQWFVSMKGMAQRAAQATREGRVKIHPQSWEKPYLLWLDEIRDWCISRQIWWGHRIPVWYCDGGCPAIAAEETPTQCPKCKSQNLRQDEDVLDTWFSSGLWPLSVLGWPDETEDLKTFYPTSVLVTGHEILYLWVARMVMLGIHFRGDIPFRDVYIHGIVRDKQGKKMSKSLGNVIDPLEIMKEYGTDALRFSMAESSVPGRDLHLSKDSFLKARNFANKLWNASRFVLMNLDSYTPRSLPNKSEQSVADRWILHELQETIATVDRGLAAYNPAEAARALYDFAWGSFCDWYLEVSKTVLMDASSPARPAKQAILVYVLENLLRLLHPVMPFETEELYQAVRPHLSESAESIMISPWPKVTEALRDPEAARRFAGLQNVTTSIRTVRSEMNVPPGQKLQGVANVKNAEWESLLQDPFVSGAIQFLARMDAFQFGRQRPAESAVAVFEGGEVYMSLTGLIDKEKESARLSKTLGTLDSQIQRGQAQLSNKDFVERAPAEEVENLKARVEVLKTQAQSIRRNLEGLQ